MYQPPTHGLEVFSTELAHDVRWEPFGAVVGSALNPRRHAIDFVLDQRLPILAVDVALSAEEVKRVVEFVALHLVFRVEGFVAAFEGTLDRPNGLEWCDHLGGLQVWRGGMNQIEWMLSDGQCKCRWWVAVSGGMCWECGWRGWYRLPRSV